MRSERLQLPVSSPLMNDFYADDTMHERHTACRTTEEQGHDHVLTATGTVQRVAKWLQPLT